MLKRPPSPARPDLDSLFAALADPDKVRLLTSLRTGAAAAGVLARRLGWTRDEASKQLNQLKRAGLVAGTPNGRSVEYGLVSAPFNAGLTWLGDLWTTAYLRMEDVDLPEPEQWTVLANALRNAGRRRMLECVCRDRRPTQAQIAAVCRLSQGQTSDGLSALVEAGLATSQQVGPVKRYEPAPRGLTLGVKWLHATYVVVTEGELAANRQAGARAGKPAPRRRTSPARDSWG